MFFLARCCLGCESEQNDPQKKAHDLVLLLWCVFGFLFCECLGIPNSPRSLDLDDRQGLIARSAMKQKKKKKARCCLGQVPGGAPFSQRSEQATACTNRMQIRN